MIYQKKTINNVATKVPLSNSAPVGNPIGTIISTYKKIQPRNYLYCDGSTFDEDQYPALYLYLGTNVLPDYRECAIVGAEKNTTDVFDSTETDPSTGLPGTQSHDVYTQGEFKDDQIQGHGHRNAFSYGQVQPGTYNGLYVAGSSTSYTGEVVNSRSGAVTRGKRKAVYYYIKAIDGVDISDEDTFLNTVKDYIDESLSYSTTEQKTGGTWIDDKPIYKRTFVYENINMTADVESTIDTNFPIENTKIVKTESFCYKPESQIFINEIRLRSAISNYRQLQAMQSVTGGTFNIYFTVYYVK